MKKRLRVRYATAPVEGGGSSSKVSEAGASETRGEEANTATSTSKETPQAKASDTSKEFSQALNKRVAQIEARYANYKD